MVEGRIQMRKCRREGLVVLAREKENMELTDIKIKRTREDNKCREGQEREKMGVQTVKQCSVKTKWI